MILLSLGVLGHRPALLEAPAAAGPPPTPAATLTSATPAHALPGASVALVGTSILVGATATVGGVAAALAVTDATHASVTVPAGAAAGSAPIVLTNAGAAPSNALAFQRDADAATLTSATPTHGLAGASVALVGTGFLAGATATVGGVAAALAVTDATHASVTVPAGAAAGSAPIVVTNPYNAASSGALAFTVDPPAATLTSATPSSGLVGDSIALVGGAITVGATATVGGVAAVLAVADASHATVTVPYGANGSAPIIVTNPGAAASNALAFTASAFTAATVAGQTLWLAGDDPGMTMNGSKVATWPDKSGGGHAFSMATSINQPVLVANAINGLPAVQFDGIQQYLTGPAFSALITFTSATIFAVFKATSAAAPGAAAYTESPLITEAAEYTGIFLNSSPRIVMQNYVGGEQISVPLRTFVLNAWFSFRGSHNAGKIYAALNGDADNAGTTAGNPGALATASIARAATGKYLGGQIAEMLIYPSALATADVAKIERYLRAKYRHY